MYTYIKRAADLSVAIISLILLSFILIAVAILIKVTSKGPILFTQKRFGKDKKPFTIYKFRTMTTDAPKNSATRDLENASSYITSIGKILRKSGLDELPQLINVVKGEMSIVGPRPVILSETDLIAERARYGANAFTPGIAGWAQSNGRDVIDIYAKARMDGDYASEFGLIMDLRCILKTAKSVLLAKGYHEGAVTNKGDIYTYGSFPSSSVSAVIYNARNK